MKKKKILLNSWGAKNNMFNFLKKNRHHEDLKVVSLFLNNHLEQVIKAKDSMPEDVFDVTRFFIEESLDIYKSMEILMRKNHFHGCIPLARSLFENSINILYIYKEDTEKRANNFKLASAQSLLKRFEGNESNVPEYMEMKNKFEEMVKDYMSDKQTIKGKFEQIGSEDIYKNAYKRLSEYVHSGYRSNRDFTVDRPFINYLKKLAFLDTLIITLQALDAICERYNLEGGTIVIDDPSYEATIFYATNPGSQVVKMKR